MQIKLVEYKYVDGQWNVKDSDMMWIYSQMEGRAQTFYNVDITKWNPLPYFRRCRVFLAFDLEGQLLGLFWVSSWNPNNKSGFFNFSWVAGHDCNPMQKVSAAAEGLRTLLDMPDFKVLYAETSDCRHVVLAFAEYLGFVKVGTIPQAHWHQDEQKWYNTVFMYVTKDTVRR